MYINTVNRPLGMHEKEKLKTRPACFRGHSHIKSSRSLCQIDASGWVGLAFDVKIWLMKYQFLLTSFLILRLQGKNIGVNKDKPSENPFNIAKNQEFELIT